MDKVHFAKPMDYSFLKETLVPIITAGMKKHKVTGVCIGVVDEGKLVFSQGFGYGDKEEGRAVTTQTVFKIGSITKVFTATAIMQLVERGLLDLDLPLTTYLPEFGVKTRFPESRPITIRDIMTHHSGLPCDNRKGFYTGSAYEKPERFTSALDYLINSYTNYPNGLVYSYSNLGISILGIVIERVSGCSYEDYILTNICRPLGMNKTTFEYAAGKDASLSKGYNNTQGEYEVLMRDLPAGGLQSTVEDMAEFLSFTLGMKSPENHLVLKPENLEKMFEEQNPDNPLDMGFKTGLNWLLSWTSLDYAGKVAWHDGGSIHYMSLLALMPEFGCGVIVLTNSERGVHVTHTVVDQALKALVLLKKGLAVPKNNRPTEVAITSQQLKELPGSYATISGLIEITSKDQEVRAKINGRLMRLVPHSDGWFSPRLLLLGKIPLRIKQLNNLRIAVRKTDIGKIMGMEQTVGENRFTQVSGLEYSPVSIPKTWINATGNYQAKGPNQFLNAIVLEYSNEMLSLKATVRKLSRINFILKPISDSEAVVQGLGRFAGETVNLREETGQITISISGLEFTPSI